MNLDFFKIWFLISPFIILHLYLKNKDYKSKANTVVQQINDVWSKDYKDIIMSYGTVENFIECHTKDFDILREYIVKVYGQISDINRDFMMRVERLLDLIENNKISEDELYASLCMIRRNTCQRTDVVLRQMNDFILNEEEAHSDNKIMLDVLKNIDDKYKNNDITKDIY